MISMIKPRTLIQHGAKQLKSSLEYAPRQGISEPTYQIIITSDVSEPLFWRAELKRAELFTQRVEPSRALQFQKSS